MISEQALVPLTDSQLRDRRSLKWSRAAPDQIPADVAEADFAVAEPIREVLSRAVAGSDLGYPDFDSPRGGPRRLAEVFAERMRQRFDVAADPGRVEICAQIMQALCCVILAFSDPGDYVLVHEPTYPPILSTIESLRRRALVVPVPEPADRGEYEIPPQRFAIIVLCNPHNPTGRLFTTGHFATLTQLAYNYNAVIFTDEVYQDLTYEASHHSIAASDGAAQRTIMFTSAAKSFNIAGLRCAVGHFGSPALHRRFQELPWHIRSGAGILGIEATITAWLACEPWLDAFRRQLRRNRDLVCDAVRAFGSACCPPESTYFAWLDLRGHTSNDSPPGNTMENRRKVTVQSGSVFGASYSGFIRLNFAVPERYLPCILSQVVQVLPPGYLYHPSSENAVKLGVSTQ